MTNKNINNTNETTNEKRMMNKKTVGIIAGATVTVAAVIISLLCLSACKGENVTATPDEVIGTSVQTVTQVVTDSQGNTHIEEETKVVEVKQTQPSEKSENAKEVNAQNTAKTDDKSDNNSGNNEQKNVSNNNSNSSQSSKTNNNSSNSGSNSNSNSNTNQGGSTSQSQSSQTSKPDPKPEVKPEPTTADPHAGKTWHEAVYEDKYYPAETEEVWVPYYIDAPIYESHPAAICNTCGEEIIGDAYEHIFAHMDKGENGSYRCETVRTIVGYEKVEVPELGHYETRVIKEAHTERELVREAGWY